MSKTVIKDNNTSDDNVDDSKSVYTELDSDNESVILDFSDIDNIEGLQPPQQVSVIPNLQTAIPGSIGRPGRPPRVSPKKTRTGKKY